MPTDTGGPRRGGDTAVMTPADRAAAVAAAAAGAAAGVTAADVRRVLLAYLERHYPDGARAAVLVLPGPGREPELMEVGRAAGAAS